MLTAEKARLKAALWEKMAAKADMTCALACREMAMQWRLIEIQATFMSAWKPDARVSGQDHLLRSLQSEVPPQPRPCDAGPAPRA